jgi:thiol-disulfide isomerase/thioredoxin
MQMRFTRKFWTNTVVITGAVAFILFFYFKYRVAPDLGLEELKLRTLEGEVVNTGQYKGKAVFLNFWQTWCGPCVHELASIEEARRLTDSTKIVFIAVTDEDPGKIIPFRDFGNYKFHFLTSDRKMPDLGINAFPTTYLIDRSGRIILTKIGAADWSSPEMIGRIKELYR